MSERTRMESVDILYGRGGLRVPMPRAAQPVVIGKAHLPIKEVLQLTTGSIVELNRGVNEQVEVLVNERLIARGEVVVVDGNYGVRIQEIATRQDRLGALA